MRFSVLAPSPFMGQFQPYSWSARQAQTGVLQSGPQRVTMRGSAVQIRTGTVFGRRGIAGGGHQLGYSLGQTGFEWYQRAKGALKQYEELLARTARIANATARQEIMTWLGHPDKDGTPAYRYRTVKGDLWENVEDPSKYVTPNYAAYDISRRTNRIVKLEDWNEEFKSDVIAAETTYGLLPAPVTLPTAGEPPAEMDLTIPILGGAGAIAVAVLISAFA